MKTFINYKWPILGTLLGAAGGYLYWKEVGCSTGTCPIQSNWQAMVPYGMLLGYTVTNWLTSVSIRK